MSDMAQEAQETEPEAQPEGEAWQGPSQEEWAEMQNRLASFEQEPEPEGEGEPEGFVYDPDEFDPNDPDQVIALVDYHNQQKEAAARDEAEAEERMFDILSDVERREGEFAFKGELAEATGFDSSDLALQVAEEIYPEEARKYGKSLKAAESAIARGYKAVRTMENVIGEQYHERKMNELRGLAQAPREPEGAGNAQAQQTTTPQQGDEVDLAMAYTRTS